MRTRDAASEAVRNVISGVSHAILLVLVTAVVAGVAMWVDLSAVAKVIDQAEAFRAMGASTWVVTLEDGINADRCDSLTSVGGVIAAGAMRVDPEGTRFSALPSLSVDTFTATPGFAKLLGVQPAEGDVWLSERLAADLGGTSPRWLSTTDGIILSSGSFAYPSDGRVPLLEYSRVNLSPTQHVFSSCWISIWPASSSLASTLRTAPLRDGAPTSDLQLTQLNSTAGTAIDPASDFSSRPTAAAGLAVGLVAGLIALAVGYLRRLEYASARHVGVTRTASTTIAAIEGAIWMLPLALIMLAVINAMAASTSPTGHAALWEAGLRIAGPALAGSFLGTLTLPMIVSSRRLIAYFRARS